MADPGFPRGGGANSPGGGHQHAILPNFPKNCMNLKEFGPPGGRPKFYYVDAPLEYSLVLFTYDVKIEIKHLRKTVNSNSTYAISVLFKLIQYRFNLRKRRSHN